MPTFCFFSTILTQVWRSLPQAKYLWDYYHTARNTSHQNTYPQSGCKQHPSRGAGEIPGLYVRGDWRRWGCTSMSSPLWPWGRVIGWEQWLALFAYSTPAPPPLPYLLFTLYPTQMKIELTLACGHSTSPELNPTAMCMSASLGPASKRVTLQPLFSHMIHYR